MDEDLGFADVLGELAFQAFLELVHRQPRGADLPEEGEVDVSGRGHRVLARERGFPEDLDRKVGGERDPVFVDRLAAAFGFPAQALVFFDPLGGRDDESLELREAPLQLE